MTTSRTTVFDQPSSFGFPRSFHVEHTGFSTIEP